MTVGEMATLVRQRWAAVAVVLVLAAGATYMIKKTPATYEEQGTVVFGTATSPANPNQYDGYNVYSTPLITTAEVVVRAMMGVQAMSTQAQRPVLTPQGAAGFNLALVNLYNQEYPDYGAPEATLTTQSASPAAVHTAFVQAARQVASQLNTLQAQAGVQPQDRIAEHIVGDTGPLLEAGSPKRVYIGLILLTLIALFTVASFVERHPRLFRRQPRMRTLRVRQPGSAA
jgi:hypothetical protein